VTKPTKIDQPDDILTILIRQIQLLKIAKGAVS